MGRALSEGQWEENSDRAEESKPVSHKETWGAVALACISKLASSGFPSQLCGTGEKPYQFWRPQLPQQK